MTGVFAESGAPIHTALITHMHPDHVGGLIDADDQPVFPKATVLVPSGELDYWRGDIPEGAPEVLPDITWIFRGSGMRLRTGMGFGFCRMFGGLRFKAWPSH